MSQQSRLDEAASLFDDIKYDEALAIIDELIEQFPGNNAYLIRRAEYLTHMGDIESAQELFATISAAGTVDELVPLDELHPPSVPSERPVDDTAARRTEEIESPETPPTEIAERQGTQPSDEMVLTRASAVVNEEPTEVAENESTPESDIGSIFNELEEIESPPVTNHRSEALDADGLEPPVEFETQLEATETASNDVADEPPTSLAIEKMNPDAVSESLFDDGQQQVDSDEDSPNPSPVADDSQNDPGVDISTSSEPALATRPKKSIRINPITAAIAAAIALIVVGAGFALTYLFAPGDSNEYSWTPAPSGPVFPSSGLSSEPTPKERMDALVGEALNGNKQHILNYVQDGHDINQSTSDGSTVLVAVMQRAQEQEDSSADDSIENTLSILIDNGADINAKDRNGRTALTYSASLGATNLIEFLLSRNAELSRDAWMVAVESCRDDSINRFLNADDSEPRHEYMMAAVKANCIEVVKALVSGNVDINATTPSRDTALSVALFGEREDPSSTSYIVIEKSSLRFAKDLIALGADVDAAMAVAVEKGSIDHIEFLRSEGASVEANNQLIFVAIEGGDKNTLKHLINQGIDLTTVNELGESPVQFAERAVEQFDVDPIVHDLVLRHASIERVPGTIRTREQRRDPPRSQYHFLSRRSQCRRGLSPQQSFRLGSSRRCPGRLATRDRYALPRRVHTRRTNRSLSTGEAKQFRSARTSTFRRIRSRQQFEIPRRTRLP